MCLAPGLLPNFALYYRSKNIIKNIKYGDQNRNYLDIYLPGNNKIITKYPVIINIFGGGWIVG